MSFGILRVVSLMYLGFVANTRGNEIFPIGSYSCPNP
jgi:hypothetical protein